MSKNRIRNVMRKEWKTIFSDVTSTMFLTVLPLLIIAQTFAVIVLIPQFAADKIMETSFFLNSIQHYGEQFPLLMQFSDSDAILFVLLFQTPVYLLLIPVMIMNGLITFSIVEEKTNGTLEPLLSTPVRTGELILGKILAEFIPAMICSYFFLGIFFYAFTFIDKAHILSLLPVNYLLFAFFILVPGFAIFAFLLGIIASSRAKDAKSAQNLSLIIVLPVFAFIALQVSGIFIFSTVNLIIASIIIILIDIFTFRFSIKLFDRENIVVSWK